MSRDDLWQHPQLETARELAMAGRVEQALATIRSHAELFDSGIGQWWMGAILIGSDREQDGVPHLVRAVELEPDAPMFVRDAALWLDHTGCGIEAVALLRKATQGQDCGPDLLLASASAYAEMGERTPAEALLRRVLALNIPDYDLLRDTAHVFARLGLHADALRTLQEASDLKSDHLGIWNEMGDAHRELGHFHEARTAYRKALQLLERELLKNPRSPSWLKQHQRTTEKLAALPQP